LFGEGIPWRVVWGCGALQIPPLRFAPVGMTKGGVVVFPVPWFRAAGVGF
jgi:hypothetical protein